MEEELLRNQQKMLDHQKDLENRVLSAIRGVAVALGVFSGIIITLLFKIWLLTA